MAGKWPDVRYKREEAMVRVRSLVSPCLLNLVFFKLWGLHSLMFFTSLSSPLMPPLCLPHRGSTPWCLTFILRVTLHFTPFLLLQRCARAQLLSLHPDCCNTAFHDITLLIQSARLPAANPQTMPQWRLASLISKPSSHSPSIPNMLTWPSSTWTSFNFLPLELPLSPYL